MLVLLSIIAVVLVVGIALGAVGTTVAKLSNEPKPTILKIADSTEWIAENLPDEVSASISYDDVKQILRWHLSYFDQVGLASRHGQELGGAKIGAVDDLPVVASTDESVDYVVERSIEAGEPVTALEVVVVLDLQWKFWREIGAIGPEV